MKKSLHDRETRSFKRANKNRWALIVTTPFHTPTPCSYTQSPHHAVHFFRPREMSSKRPVSRFREVVPVAKVNRRERRDPRFEETAGQLNPDLFKKSYAFVDDLKKKEKQLLQKEVKKTKSTERKAQLQKLLLQMVRSLNPPCTHTHTHTHTPWESLQSCLNFNRTIKKL